MILNQKQTEVFNGVVKGENLFATGPGGVGKSVIINQLKDNKEFEEETVFLAPTGVSAQNIKGATFHRTFQFPFGFIDAYHRKQVSYKAKEIFSSNQIKRVLIDEISMTRGDIISAVDMNLRLAKRKNIPFGGLQIVMVGDFFQLSPVLNEKSTEGYHYLQEFKSPFAFDTDTWKDSGIRTIQLDQIMRQSDQTMINALNEIRIRGDHFREALEMFNRSGLNNEDVDEENALFLCSTNKDADIINQDSYANLETEPRCYTGVLSGKFKECPVPLYLEMKIGCKVMICANNHDSGYYNGQIGYVKEMFEDMIAIELTSGETIHITKYKWEEYDYVKDKDGKVTKTVIGSYVQFPIKIGYAVTIHKAQGLSLDNAIIYTGRGCFAHGQAYVALSRLRTMKGLKLLDKIYPSEIIVDQRVKDFYDGKIVTNLFDIMK